MVYEARAKTPTPSVTPTTEPKPDWDSFSYEGSPTLLTEESFMRLTVR